MVIKHRPVKRLLRESPTGEGKAQVATKKQFKNILWQASRGTLGKRNVAIIWMLFGSGLRINEVAKLEVKDLLYPTGELKTTFTVKGTYTKTDRARAAFILAKQHKSALEAWLDEMIEEKVGYSENGAYRSLQKDWPIFAVTKKGKSWRKMSFRHKKYKDANGQERTTPVCSSMQTLISDLFKNSGLYGGSTHSGRRTLASWLDAKGVELEVIQQILGHEDPDMTLQYIDPNFDRIKTAYDKVLSNIK